VIALWLATAFAAPQLTAGVEVQPDLLGVVEERGMLELLVHEPLGPVDLHLVGGARFWSGKDAGVLPMVQRLTVDGQVGDVRVSAGRLVERDERGAQRIDGVLVDHVDAESGLVLRGWGGRLWRPERTDEVPFGSGTWVGGFEARVHPERVGESRWWVSGAVGSELRVSDVATGRLYGTLAAETPRGDRMTTLAEVDVVALDGTGKGIRAIFDGDHPIGPRLDAVYEARWEGVRRTAVPDAEDGPLAWIAPHGYGIGEIGFRSRGPGAMSLSVTPMFRPRGDGTAVGGGGLLAAVRVGEGVDLFGRAAGVGVSRFYGGGFVVRRSIGRAAVSATGACWGLAPLDDRPRLVSEVRLRADVPIGGTGWTVAGQVRAGTDRLLPGWLRGGVMLTAPIGGGSPR
jgi:hypothetical protein